MGGGRERRGKVGGREGGGEGGREGGREGGGKRKRRQKWDMRGKITINKARFHSHMKLTLNNSYPVSSPEPGYEANGKLQQQQQ